MKILVTGGAGFMGIRMQFIPTIRKQQGVKGIPPTRWKQGLNGFEDGWYNKNRDREK